LGEFVAACLAGLRAFQSSPELAESFDRMFDGTEVLPSGLYEEYEELRVSELLVPISSRQLARLGREGRIVTRLGEDPIVVSLPYDSTAGLVLKGGN
jgi:hypothetical protein